MCERECVLCKFEAACFHRLKSGQGRQGLMRERVCVRVCACASDSVTTKFEKCDKIFPQKNKI